MSYESRHLCVSLDFVLYNLLLIIVKTYNKNNFTIFLSENSLVTEATRHVYYRSVIIHQGWRQALQEKTIVSAIQ